MRFIHTADLHIGKSLSGYSLIEDQTFILNGILQVAKAEKADAILLAGDIYDKSIPSEEAVRCLEAFTAEADRLNIPLYVISGNHDSAERIGYAHERLRRTKLYLSHRYDGSVEKIVQEDESGKVNIYLLPFIRPADVKAAFGLEGSLSYTDALARAIEELAIDKTERNVLVTHQFVSGSSQSGSEDIFSVGGTDNVDPAVFEAFDYVALGHIHRPQKVGQNMRYSGTPLKYSVDEASQEKSLVVVDILQKGCVETHLVPLKSLRDLRVVEGTMEEVMAMEKSDDYVYVRLGDENDISDAYRDLKKHFPHLVGLDYINRSYGSSLTLEGLEKEEGQSPFEIISAFYQQQNARALGADAEEFLERIVEETWGRA